MRVHQKGPKTVKSCNSCSFTLRKEIPRKLKKPKPKIFDCFFDRLQFLKQTLQNACQISIQLFLLVFNNSNHKKT